MTMTETQWSVKCPKCGGTSLVTSVATPTVNCGDCLFDRIEVVKMTATPVSP